MKFLCVLLSLYVVLLSVIPCCTDDVCGGKTAVAKTQPGKFNNSDDSGTCSPFYRCGSCSGFAVLVQALPGVKIPGSSQIPPTAYRQPFIKDVSPAIWQPPQLG